MESIGLIRDFLKDIQQRRFIKVDVKYTINKKGVRVGHGEKSHDVEKIRNDFRFLITRDWLYEKYIKEEYSRNYLVKEYKLEVSPIVFRKIFDILEIPTRKVGESTKRANLLKSEKAKREYETKTGWWSEKVVRQCKGYSGRGLQGYYFNKSRQRLVWLRSSFEYIFAKWLDRNNFNWNVECERFEVKGKMYKPDFFIYEKNKLVKIVEIKGYWDTGKWKAEELNKLLSVEVVIINKDEIYSYTDNINKDIEEWKKLRSKRLELKK